MELLDIYTAAHERTGRTVPWGGEVGEGDRLLAAHVCVLNSRGEMLVQKRQPTKDRYPGCWDVSSGGFALAGEDSPDAALRELREEIGLTPPKEELRFLFTEPFSCVLDDFYMIRADLSPGTLRLQAEEVSEAKWMGREELVAAILDGSFIDYPVGPIEEVFRLAAEAPA